MPTIVWLISSSKLECASHSDSDSESGSESDSDSDRFISIPTILWLINSSKLERVKHSDSDSDSDSDRFTARNCQPLINDSETSKLEHVKHSDSDRFIRRQTHMSTVVILIDSESSNFDHHIEAKQNFGLRSGPVRNPRKEANSICIQRGGFGSRLRAKFAHAKVHATLEARDVAAHAHSETGFDHSSSVGQELNQSHAELE